MNNENPSAHYMHIIYCYFKWTCFIFISNFVLAVVAEYVGRLSGHTATKWNGTFQGMESPQSSFHSLKLRSTKKITDFKLSML